ETNSKKRLVVSILCWETFKACIDERMEHVQQIDNYHTNWSRLPLLHTDCQLNFLTKAKFGERI
ncbi:hypothetical protein KK467_29430, partial [Klebsiella pneumoniae]|uniref:hypothetical protein n=1 Tax=Klebsiella pneumoniae TaxID=573 RepID=UPI001BE03C5D